MNNTQSLIDSFDDSKVVITENKKLRKDDAVVQYGAAMEGSSEYEELIRAINRDTTKGIAVYFNKGDKVAFKDWDHLPIKVIGLEKIDGKLFPLCSAYTVCDRKNLGTFEFNMSLIRRIPSDIRVDILYKEDGSIARTYQYEESLHEELVANFGESRVKTVESQEYFLEDNPVGQVMCKVMSDWQRCKILAGKGIECTERIRLYKPVFDSGRRVPDQFEPMTVYKFKWME